MQPHDYIDLVNGLREIRLETGVDLTAHVIVHPDCVDSLRVSCKGSYFLDMQTFVSAIGVKHILEKAREKALQMQAKEAEDELL